MRLPSPSETDSSSGHERSPLEPLPFTDGEIAGQGAEKRPRPTEQPHSGLYPLRVLSTKVLSLISSFGIPRNNSRERSKLSSILAEGSLNLQTAGKQLTPSRGKILTDGDCYTPSETDRQQPRKKLSGASYLHGWGDSRAKEREAATAQKNGLTDAYIFPKGYI